MANKESGVIGEPHMHTYLDNTQQRPGKVSPGELTSDSEKKRSTSDLSTNLEKQRIDGFPVPDGLTKQNTHNHLQDPQWRRASVASHPEVKDLGADLFLEIDDIGEERLQQLDRKVRWKLDLIIMPIVCTTHALQFLNKSSPNFVSALGIIPELGLQHGRYAWVAAIFNFGFMAWSFPTNVIIQRVPIAKYTASVIIVWALLQMCCAASENYGGILAVRFLLGMAEAAIAPSAMNIVALWYPRAEAPFRLCLVLGCNGGAWMIASILSYGCGHLQHLGVRPWQLYFLFTGILNFLVGILFFIFVPDTPHNAWWLSREEKVCATWRTSKNMVGLKTKVWKNSQAIEAFKDFKVWCTWIMAAAIGIIIGGVINFASALLESFGITGIESTLLELPLGAIAFVTVPAAGLIATFVPNTRCAVTIFLCLPPLGGLIGIRLLNLPGNKWNLLGCAWLQLLVLGLICLNWIIMTANIGGHTKRTVANGVWFVLFAAGNIGGAHIFLAKEKPRYFTAITVLYICYAIVIVTCATLWAWMFVQNKRRERKLLAEGKTLEDTEREAILQGFKDETDFENQGFRYAY